MVNVIGVRFKNAGKLYFFDPGAHWPTAGDYVIVETVRGVEIGEVVTGVKEIDESQLSSPLKQVIRVADSADVERGKQNEIYEKQAHAICQKKIEEHKLDMKLVSTEYTFDNTKLLFYFTANGRVDFRTLVKDLATTFRTRIELRQIGARDEAKMLGGLGVCGRPLCCNTFLGDVQNISIKMAKEQNLSMNPAKISGVCGRLMCCLKYEEEHYEKTRRQMPRVGREVETPDGHGVVWDVNVLKETVRVRVQKGDSGELKDYPLETLQELNPNQKPDRTEKAPASDGNEKKDAQPARPAHCPKANDAKESAEENYRENSEEVASAEPENEQPANSWLAAVQQAMEKAQGEKSC